MDKIKTIAHLSDIHIRKLHRFVEYREVFKRLYKQLKKIKPDLIYVGGDVVHGKLDTSPEETRLVASFFLELTDIADTIVITGNHDVNLQNKSREDALSPIIDLVKKINPNIHYWKQSGAYTIKNVDFGVLSIFDVDKYGNQTTNKLPDFNQFNSEYKVALHHGPVDTFVVDNGFQMTNKSVTVNTFDDYDITMLGDIHKRQFLNKDKNVAYCGSLIQQSFAEDGDHGFLLWDLEAKSSTYHTVENDYGFKTINVINGNVENSMKFIPPKGNIRIKYWDTTLEQIKDIQINLRKQYPKLKEVKTEKQDTLSALDKGSRINKIDIGDVRDIKYQNKLIEDFLKRNIDHVDDNTIQRICNINEMTNDSPEIYDGGIARNVSWKLKSFEFDNMFSYKKGNVVNFEKMNGIVGLVAPNHSGKSAMLDAVAYTIFDTCSRTFKAMDVLNKRKQEFKAKLNLEINGEDYWIEREGLLKSRKSRKTGEVTYTCPVSVKFYMVDGDQHIDLTGAARRNSQYGSGTNEEIRKILGTFDDFILTSLSLQTNNANFVDKKQSERKQVLSQFMDINIFDELYEIAREDSNEERILLKSFQKKDSYAELATVEQKIKENEGVEKQILKDLKSAEGVIKELQTTKLKLTKNLWKIEDWDVDIELLEASLNAKEKERRAIEHQLGDDIEYKETLRPLYLEYHDKLGQLDEEKIKSDYENHQSISHQINEINYDLKSTESEIVSTRLTLKELNIYKYDPNCAFCLKNASEHIAHSKRAQESLDRSTDKKNALIIKSDDLSQQLQGIINAVEDREECDRFTEELNQISHDAIKIGGKITTTEEKVKLLMQEISESKEKINKYYELEQKIKKNQQINIEIEEFSTKIQAYEEQKSILSSKHRAIISKVAVAKTERERLEQDIQKLFEIEQKILDYDLYMMAMSRDGVPYELISKTIPSIESEVNEVLDNMMVGFTIKLEMEGTNINTYICYGDEQWPLELASGMERFVSSLAIRVGLINVSTLPRPNFLCLDEGFGSLDGESIANMRSAFDYLKTQFDFVLIITHLDAIKDYTDSLIPIDVKNGFSRVIFT